MAHAVASLGSWHSRDASVGRVLAALDRLRRDVPAGTATRTSVLTLVAVAADPAECARAVDALHGLGTSHPARTVGIVARTDPQPLEATISLHGTEEAGRMLWSEDIELAVGGPIARHLNSLIEPLTLPDLPVVVWFVDDVPEAEVSGALVDAADAVIVDGRDLAGAASFAAIRSMAQRRPVVDLSWIRLQPWRELLASLFEGHHRPFVHAVTSAEVRGKPGPRRLLAGWLADRLELPRRAFSLVDADYVCVRLGADSGGSRGEFSVVRRGDERALVASAAVAPEAPHTSLRLLPPDDPEWGLQTALTSLTGDPVYHRAIDAATTLMS